MREPVALLLGGAMLLLQGCGSTAGHSTSTGGAPGSGGVTGAGGSATGGSPAGTGGNTMPIGGGSPAAGGQPASGGAPVSGGQPGAGGALVTGGQPVTGGKAVGGATGAGGTGGTPASGGAPSTGGVTPTGGNTSSSARTKIVLNAGWTFYKGDATGAQATAFSDDAWTKVNLPHVFDTPYYALKKGVFWYVGYGWYRKHFNVQADWTTSKRIVLEFEAAFQVAEVYVNGTLMDNTRADLRDSIST